MFSSTSRTDLVPRWAIDVQEKVPRQIGFNLSRLGFLGSRGPNGHKDGSEAHVFAPEITISTVLQEEPPFLLLIFSSRSHQGLFHPIILAPAPECSTRPKS
jgi:hypothetical protein